MASITIRNLDDDVKTRLRVRAAQHHRSMEEEARLILDAAVTRKRSSRNLAESIRARIAPLGGVDLDSQMTGKTRAFAFELPSFTAQWKRRLHVILRHAVGGGRTAPKDLTRFTRECFAPLGGVELELPPRGPMRELPDLS